MPEQSSFEEKRRDKRTALYLPLDYCVPGNKRDFGASSTRDISLGGLSFLTDEFVAPKTNLTLNICFQPQIVRLDAKVVWSARLTHSDRYCVGSEFLDMDSKERDFICDYINIHSI